jgi:hypothetical protein
MNELERMCAEVPPPDEPAIMEGRRRLLVAARHADSRVPVKSARRPWFYRQWQVLVPSGLAAALVVGVIVVQQTDGGPATPSPAKNVGASEVLHRAAAFARSEPELHLRSGGYLYVRSKNAWGPGVDDPGEPKGGETREVWLSVDGSKPGLLRAPCDNDPARSCDTPLVNEDAPGRQPVPVPGSHLWNVQNIPKLLAGWRAEMNRPNPRPTEPPGSDAWEGVNSLLGESYVPPKLRAQIFDFLADVPGTKVEENTTDFIGRRGIAITKTMYKTRSEFIFDRSTYRFLGRRLIYLGQGRPITDLRRQPEGVDVDVASAILEVKAVDALPPTS